MDYSIKVLEEKLKELKIKKHELKIDRRTFINRAYFTEKTIREMENRINSIENDINKLGK